MKTSVEIVSEASHERQSFDTDDTGRLVAKRLPYGVYEVHVEVRGFAPYSESIEIRSSARSDRSIQLRVAAIDSTVKVSDQATIVDPYRSGSINQIDSDFIENRPTALPGRSLQDLVNSQPGWLHEGNAVLHPRAPYIRRSLCWMEFR